MISEKTAKKLETDIEWNGRANVCVHCGRVPETFYVATGHDHTDYDIRWCPCREPNPNWCAGCSPDNCSGCGAEPVDSEPAMWVMKHIRSGDLAQAKPNQKALHPYMWSDAFPRYTTPQPVRTAELEAALKVARDFESDVDTATQHNVELQLETIALKSALREAHVFLDHCWRDVQLNDFSFEYLEKTIATINEVLK